MGIPVEPRLSDSARLKRQRLIASDSGTSLSNISSRSSIGPSSNRTFGLNRAAVESMVAYYEAQTEGMNSSTRKGHLTVVRTALPRPVRVLRSAVSRLGNRISRLLERDGEVVQYAGMFGIEEDESDGESEGENESPMLTSIAVSILYVEDGEGGRVWDLGCWAGAHQMAGIDMFQVFLDVLTEATCVPTCRIADLWIRDNLEVYLAVAEGVDLLKDLSAELHPSYDKDSSYFLHPLTGAPIDIVVER